MTDGVVIIESFDGRVVRMRDLPTLTDYDDEDRSKAWGPHLGKFVRHGHTWRIYAHASGDEKYPTLFTLSGGPSSTRRMFEFVLHPPRSFEFALAAMILQVDRWAEETLAAAALIVKAQKGSVRSSEKTRRR